MNLSTIRTVSAASLCVFVLAACLPATPKPVTPPAFVPSSPPPTQTPRPEMKPSPTTEPSATPRPQPLEFVTTIGRGILQRVAVSPDGTAIAAASNTGVTLHDADTLDVIWTESAAAYVIGALGWTADGSTVLVGRYLPPERRSLEVVWLDAESGDTLESLTVEGGHPLVQSFSPDGTQALIQDINIDEWSIIDLASGDKTVVLDGAMPGDEALWLPNGHLLISIASQQSMYHLSDWQTGQILIEASDTAYFGNQMAFSPDSTRAALTLYDVDPATNAVFPRTYLYDLDTGEIIWRIDLELRNLLWVDDATLLGAAGSVFDQTVVRIDAQAGEVVEEYTGGPLPLDGLGNLHPGPPGRIVSTTPDSLLVFDSDSFEVLAEASGYVADLWSVRFSPDGSQILTTLSAATRLWDSQTGEQVLQIDGVAGRGDWSPDGTHIAVIDGTTGQIGAWDAASGAGDFRFETGLFSPGAALWLAGDHLLVTATSRIDQGLAGFVEEYAVALFDLESGAQLFREDTDSRADVMAAPPDGEVFAYALNDAQTEGGSIVIGDSETGDTRAVLELPIGSAWSLAWSPDGARLAGAFAFQVAIWGRDGTRLAEVDMPDIIGGVTGLGWSADGRLLYGIGRHRTGGGSYILVWDASTGALLMPHVRMDDDPLDALTASRDGLLLVDHNGRMEVWRLADLLP